MRARTGTQAHADTHAGRLLALSLASPSSTYAFLSSHIHFIPVFGTFFYFPSSLPMASAIPFLSLKSLI